jgi:uncharacterized protein
MKALFAAALAFLVLALPARFDRAEAAPKFPALTGRVVDDAHILSDTTKQDLTQKLAALESKTSRQLVVVTLSSLQGYEISDYGYQLGRAWGIGQKDTNNGALLIVAPTEHRVRIEVGYGLEPILTDAFSSVVIQTQITPRFKKGDFDGGVTAGVDALVQQLSLETSAAEQKAADAAQQLRRGDDGIPAGGIHALIVFLIVLFVIFRIFGGWGFLPFLLMGSGRSRGGWSSGGGSWGGGGFSGGGGSFGGGGASGSW